MAHSPGLGPHPPAASSAAHPRSRRRSPQVHAAIARATLTPPESVPLAASFARTTPTPGRARAPESPATAVTATYATVPPPARNATPPPPPRNTEAGEARPRFPRHGY